MNLKTLNFKQQINFIGRIERNEGAIMFFIVEKLEETTFEFSQNAATVLWSLLHIIMETQKIAKLLGNADSESSKFATRKWYFTNDQSNNWDVQFCLYCFKFCNSGNIRHYTIYTPV